MAVKTFLSMKKDGDRITESTEQSMKELVEQMIIDENGEIIRQDFDSSYNHVSSEVADPSIHRLEAIRTINKMNSILDQGRTFNKIEAKNFDEFRHKTDSELFTMDGYFRVQFPEESYSNLILVTEIKSHRSALRSLKYNHHLEDSDRTRSRESLMHDRELMLLHPSERERAAERSEKYQQIAKQKLLSDLSGIGSNFYSYFNPAEKNPLEEILRISQEDLSETSELVFTGSEVDQEYIQRTSEKMDGIEQIVRSIGNGKLLKIDHGFKKKPS